MLLVFKHNCRHIGATVGSNEMQSGSLNFEHFIKQPWPYIGNNTANIYFQVVQRL